MNQHERPSDLESTLRRLVAPDAAAVERVLAGAVSRSDQHRRRPVPWVWASAVLTTCAIAVGVWQWPRPDAREGEPATLTITGNRAAVVVEHRDGRRWVVTPRSGSVAQGSVVIVIER